MTNKLHLVGIVILVFAFLVIPINQSIAYASDIVRQDGYVFDKSNGEITKYNGKSSNVVIPDKIDGVAVQKINGMAFNMWQGKKITIPSGVLEIGDYAFCCGCLQDICVDKKNPNYSSEDGVLFNKDKTVLIKYPDDKSGASYTIPDGVKEIKGGAFECCDDLISITIPDSLKMTSAHFGSVFNLKEVIASKTNPYHTTIDGVLYDKDMKTIIQYPREKEDKRFVIPDSITTIAGGAFVVVSHLEEIQIPESVTEIENSAFSGCTNLKTIDIPQNITILENCILGGCGIESIDIPNSVTEIESGVFNCCMLKSIRIPDSVSSIGKECFFSCTYLKTITMPDCITKIEESTFSYCSALDEIILPKDLVSIGDKAFLGCDSLKEITIPEGVKTIGKDAFAYCPKLKKVVLPQSVISIDNNAFKMTSLTIYGKTGSYAESYAKIIGKVFIDEDESLEEATPVDTPSPTMIVEETSANNLKSSSVMIYLILATIILLVIGVIIVVIRNKKS